MTWKSDGEPPAMLYRRGAALARRETRHAAGPGARPHPAVRRGGQRVDEVAGQPVPLAPGAQRPASRGRAGSVPPLGARPRPRPCPSRARPTRRPHATGRPPAPSSRTHRARDVAPGPRRPGRPTASSSRSSSADRVTSRAGPRAGRAAATRRRRGGRRRGRRQQHPPRGSRSRRPAVAPRAAPSWSGTKKPLGVGRIHRLRIVRANSRPFASTPTRSMRPPTARPASVPMSRQPPLSRSNNLAFVGDGTDDPPAYTAVAEGPVTPGGGGSAWKVRPSPVSRPSRWRARVAPLGRKAEDGSPRARRPPR